MNAIITALKEMEAEAGKSGRWKLEELCKMAALEITTKAEQVASLYSANEAMQEDAVQNTYAFNLMLEANRSQAAEIAALKAELAGEDDNYDYSTQKNFD
jgi:hypothetical protein